MPVAQKTIWCVLGHLLNAQDVREHVKQSLTETTDLELIGLTLLDLTVQVSGVVAEPDDRFVLGRTCYIWTPSEYHTL